MRICIISLLAAMLCLGPGCDFKHTDRLKYVDFGKPSLVIQFANLEDNTRENIQNHGLDAYGKALSTREGESHWFLYFGHVGNSSEVDITIFEKEPLDDGSLKLRFEIIHNSEVHEVGPLIWDQKEDKLLIAGADWLVKLTNGKKAWKSQIR